MLIAQEPATLGVFRLRQGRLLAPVHILEHLAGWPALFLCHVIAPMPGCGVRLQALGAP